MSTLALLYFRYYIRDAQESQASEVELFLNSVPILNPLSREEKLKLLDAFEQQHFAAGSKVTASCTILFMKVLILSSCSSTALNIGVTGVHFDVRLLLPMCSPVH